MYSHNYGDMEVVMWCWYMDLEHSLDISYVNCDADVIIAVHVHNVVRTRVMLLTDSRKISH